MALVVVILAGCSNGTSVEQNDTASMTPPSVTAPTPSETTNATRPVPAVAAPTATTVPVELPTQIPPAGIAVVTPIPGTATSTVPPVSPRQVFTVDTVSDDMDTSPGDGDCRTENDRCSLRAALMEANLAVDHVLIAFALHGAGPHAIRIERTLPVINNPRAAIIIDGYTQPGARPNTDPLVSNAIIMVQIVGPRSIDDPRSIDALHIASSGNEVRGLSFSRLRRSLSLVGADATGNVIAGNFIGIGADGEPWYDAIDDVEHRGGDNAAYGIWLANGASFNVIGGNASAARNVISGNANDGVAMRGDVVENVIIGNIVGLRPDGSLYARNWGDGIDLNYGAARNRIGGLGEGEKNLISGNHGEGIEISHGPMTSGNIVQGNLIGTDATGLSGDPLGHGNTGYGVSLEGDVTDNVIGPGNIIANNEQGGIHVYGPQNTGNIITGNAIGVNASGAPLPNRGEGIHVRYEATDQTIGPDNVIAWNDGPGILLADSTVQRVTITGNSVHRNGTGDIVLAAPGTNGRVAPPELTFTMAGTVRGRACPSCIVEIFAVTTAAEVSDSRVLTLLTLLTTVTADRDGAFILRLHTTTLPVILAATATDVEGNTSAYSEPIDLPAR